MYFIPYALFVKSNAGPEFWASIEQSQGVFSILTWQNFFVANLIPVTLGNIVGGALMVGLVYWYNHKRGTAEIES